MTFIYSPEFNPTSYIDFMARRSQLVGLKVCGSNELLAELELRAGIAHLELSEPERLVAYHDAIKERVGDTVFASSFATDEIGVSRQLLSWRDHLLMAGWNPQEHLFTTKLKDLSRLESDITLTSQASRWNDVYAYVKEHQLFGKGDRIEVHAAPEALPLVIRRTLDVLKEQGIVKYVQSDGNASSTPKLKVYQFRTRTAAYQWYLSCPEALNDVNVTVSTDNCQLNDMSIALNKPLVNSRSVESNPQVLQLFKLGMSLFARPLNVYNLLSYLQVPGHPAKGVAFQLARVLADEGGVNDKWQEAIDNFDFTNDEGEDERKKCLKYLSMVTKAYDPNEIPVADVNDYANNLANWCDLMIRSKHVSDERKEQLVVLASFCRSLVQTLKGKGTVSSEELLVAVDGIYQPQSFTHFKAQKGSPDFVSSITQLADSVDNVCWLGCVGSSLPAYPYDFLNDDEMKKLNEQGLTIPSKTEFYTQYRQMQSEALRKVRGQLTLVCWEFDGNERQEEHPLLIELKSAHKDDWAGILTVDEKPRLEETTNEVVHLDILPDYQLNADQLCTLRRERESNSSIDKLIQYPFDYTLEYLLKLREPTIGQLDDLNTTKGNVAHFFIENLVNEFGAEMPQRYKGLSDEEQDERIEAAIRQKGAILLLPEYKMEMKQFCAKLKESARVLADVISELGLQPVGCEVEMNVCLEDIGPFEAKIDMVLQQTSNPSHYVIFDFKWNEGQTYEKKLRENRAMQLEFYLQAATKYYEQLNQNAEIVGTAYYLFPLCKLFTTSFSTSTSDHIVNVEVNADAQNRVLFAELKNSYAYRRAELDAGRVEDSERCKIDDIPYKKDSTIEHPLYPLNESYNKKGIKSCPYVKTDKPPFAKKSPQWEKSGPDVREIKTTHPILKGRLL